jgi:hypothetical protein
LLLQNFFSKKYVIAPENFADMVYTWIRLSGEGQEKAGEKAEPFLNMIHDPRRRVYYAEKFQNYDVAMDVSDLRRCLCGLAFLLKTIASALRDRVQLEHLRRRIPQDHPSYHRATALLEVYNWKKQASSNTFICICRIRNGETKETTISMCFVVRLLFDFDENTTEQALRCTCMNKMNRSVKEKRSL